MELIRLITVPIVAPNEMSRYLSSDFAPEKGLDTKSSSSREPLPKALTKPYVRLSPHTALLVQPFSVQQARQQNLWVDSDSGRVPSAWYKAILAPW